MQLVLFLLLGLRVLSIIWPKNINKRFFFIFIYSSLVFSFYCWAGFSSPLLFSRNWATFHDVSPDEFCNMLVVILCFAFWVCIEYLNSHKTPQPTSLTDRQIFQVHNDWSFISLISAYLVIFGTLSLVRNSPFDTGDLDIFNDAITNFSFCGNFYSRPIGGSYMSHHFAPLVLAYVPPYKIFYGVIPTQSILLLSQTLVITSGAIPIYLMAQERLRSRYESLLIVAIYLLYSHVEYNNLFQYHPDHIFLVTVLWIFYFLDRNRMAIVTILLLVCAMVKEAFLPVVAVLGLYLFFVREKYLPGILTCLGAMSLFLFYIKTYIPFFASNLQGVFIGSEVGLSNTSDLFTDIFNLIFSAFTPLIFIPFLAWDILWLVILGLSILRLTIDPSLYKIMLTLDKSHHEIIYHYAAPWIPFVFIAFLYGIERAGKNRHLLIFFSHLLKIELYPLQVRRALLATALIISVVINVIQSPSPWSFSFWKKDYNKVYHWERYRETLIYAENKFAYKIQSIEKMFENKMQMVKNKMQLFSLVLFLLLGLRVLSIIWPKNTDKRFLFIFIYSFLIFYFYSWAGFSSSLFFSLDLAAFRGINAPSQFYNMLVVIFCFAFWVCIEYLNSHKNPQPASLADRQILQVHNDWSFISLISAYLVIFGTLSFVRYVFFDREDLTIFNETITNFSFCGNFHSQSIGISYMAHHFSPIIVAYVPLYKIFYGVIPTQSILLLFQTLVITSGAIPIYLMAQERLRSRYESLLIVAIYLLYSHVEYNNLFQYHTDHIFFVTVLWLFYFLDRNRMSIVIILLFVCAMIKETFLPVVAVLGLYLFFVREKYLPGILTCLGAMSLFLFYIKVVVPSIDPTFAYLHLKGYNSVGIGWESISVDISNLIFSAFTPFVFIPLLACNILWLAIPGFSIQCLSTYISHREIIYHYATPWIPFVFIAFLYGIERAGKNRHLLIFFSYLLKRELYPLQVRRALLVTSLIISIVMNIFQSPSPWSFSFWKKDYNRVYYWERYRESPSLF